MEAAKSTSRQLAARRRREPRGQRQEELLFSRMPDHRFTIAVVRSPGPAPGGRVNSNRPAVRSWTSAVKPLPPHPPPVQKLPAKAYTVRGQVPPFLPSQRSQSRSLSRSRSRSRAAEPVSAAPAKNRSNRQHKQPGSGTWWRTMPVKAKVDSHWFKPNDVLPTPRQEPPSPGMRKMKTSKSLAEAHEQLELMLSRIERAKDFLPPPPAAATTTSKRRSVPIMSVRGGPKVVDKVAKGVSRHMAQPPPAPPGSPRNGARRSSASVADRHLPAVPLAHNPQRLMPAERDALLELLQRTEQHDRGIMDMVRSDKSGDQPARETEWMGLHELPLSLNESPYSGRDWKLAGSYSVSPKERPELHPQIEGQVLPPRTMAGEQRDGKQPLVMHMEEKIRQLNDRQEQAMRERAELEQHKLLVTICREKRCQRDKMKQLAQLKKQQQRNGGDANVDKNVPEPQTTIILKDPLAFAPIPVPFDPWKQLLQERDRFQSQCQRSYFYNNSRSPAPWKMYARVASKLSSQLVDILDANFKQPSINQHFRGTTPQESHPETAKSAINF